VENKLTYNECKQYGLYNSFICRETPRKFITAKKTKQKKTKNKQTKKLNKTIIFKVCSLKLLYVLSPCKHTKNLVRPIFYLLIGPVHMGKSYPGSVPFLRNFHWGGKTGKKAERKI
jgi:hypothetical protein